jgi:hypothetical protein
MTMFRSCPASSKPVLAFLMILAGTTCATGAVIEVQPDGSINDALALAVAGDTVLVSEGTYHEQNLLLADGVILQGAPGAPGDVVVVTDGSESALVVEQGAGTTTRVEGITFTRGPGNPLDVLSRGGGVLCLGASPIFQDCRFENLKAAYGGAVFCGEGAQPLFISCVFRDNRAEAVGGALAAVSSGAPRLEHCLVVHNSAQQAGGAFNLARGVQLELEDCTVAGNSGSATALSCWSNARALATRCIISDAGVWLGDDSGLTLAHCSDMHETGGLVPLDPSSTQNIALDPLFCASLAGDHQYDLADASPCTPEASPGCGGMGSRPTGCGTSSVDDPPLPDDLLPQVSGLRDAYPNPFNPSTTIRYDLALDGQISLAVYDVAGRLVRELVREHRAAGSHQEVWLGRDARGQVVAAGVYFVHLKTLDGVDTRRITLVK